MCPYRPIRKALITTVIFLIALSGVACGKPGSSILDTPNPSLDTCQTDSDCALAIRVDVCCSCPEVTTQARIRGTEGIEAYIPGRDYGSLRPARCARVDCSPYPLPPAGAICRSSKCRAPETVQEILAACSNCYVQAAQAAYQAGDLQDAIEFCAQSASEQQFICFSQLFNIALDANNPDEAETLCRQHLDQDVGSCLRPLALKWANLDDQQAVALCNELDPADARHFGCMLDVARAIKPQNQERALEICERLPTDEAELCRQEIFK
jgi:hypothetical protein